MFWVRWSEQDDRFVPERVLRAGALTIEVVAEDDAGETQAFSAYEPFGAASRRAPRRLAILR